MKTYYTSRIPLYIEIQQVKKPTSAKIKKMYGQLGLDIFEGKEKISILSDKENKPFKKFVNNIKAMFAMPVQFEYQKKDTMKDILLKYMFNKNSGTNKEIEEKFGEKGLECLQYFKLLEYVE